MQDQARTQPRRWTRDYIFDILRALEIGCIFGVPGTNEIPIIDGTETPENKGKVRYVECLHENIALGAAMGYARMTGRPGVVELHVTPGIGHCIGNLSNAWKSRVPLVILCGQQQNELVTQEPLLASDLVQLARQYTKWSHELRAWEEMPLVLQRAFKEAMAPPMGPVFLSLPWDFTIREIGADERIRGVTRIPHRFTGDAEAVNQAAQLLAGAKSPVIIAGDSVGYSGAWKELQELALLLGAPVYLEGFSSLANFPNSDYHWQGELPGGQQQVQQRLAPHDVAFLCGFGSQAQLAVFKYSDGPLIPATVRQVALANNTWDLGKNHYAESAILGDIKATLPALNALLVKHPAEGADARNQKLQAAAEQRVADWRQYVTQAQQAETIWGVLVADGLRELLVEKGLQKRYVYVHEAISDAPSFQMLLPLGDGAAPTSYYCTAGGSLGWSMPASLGIKLSAHGAQGIEPELVINAVGDGSSLFYPQVWWTAAHQQLPVLYIIMNNQEYRTLQVGLQQVVTAYGDAPGYGWKPVTMTPEYLTLRDPEFSFVDLAKSFGVPNGRVVKRPDEVRTALREAMEHVLTLRQSYVLDVRLDHTPPPPPADGKSKSLKSTRTFAGPPPLDAWFQGLRPERDEEKGPRLRGTQVVF
ncbi:thiamine pyrophosphate-binding protein [Myxococcaceae bacterium GXIMD 01537]